MLRRNTQGTALTRRGEGAVARWSPFEEMDSLRREMDDLFTRAFGYTPLSRLMPQQAAAFEPAVDIFETDEAIQVFAALPGFAPEDIHVEATQDTLTLQGECKPCYQNENAIPHRQSWLSAAGNFSVSYTLPAEIDPKKVKATFRNGVLQLEMPKTEQARRKAVKIDVQSGS